MKKQKSKNKFLNKGVYEFAIKGDYFYWRAAIKKYGKVVTIGYFDKFRDAVQAYVVAHESFYGERPTSRYQDPSSGKQIRITI